MANRPRCLDCNKQLARYDAKRCPSCARKGKKPPCSFLGRKHSKKTKDKLINFHESI